MSEGPEADDKTDLSTNTKQATFSLKIVKSEKQNFKLSKNYMCSVLFCDYREIEA